MDAGERNQQDAHPSPQHVEAVKILKAKVAVLSREFASLSQERDLLLEFVLGSGGTGAGAGAAPQEMLRQLFSERQAQMQRIQVGGSLPTSLGAPPQSLHVHMHLLHVQACKRLYGELHLVHNFDSALRSKTQGKGQRQGKSPGAGFLAGRCGTVRYLSTITLAQRACGGSTKYYQEQPSARARAQSDRHCIYVMSTSLFDCAANWMHPGYGLPRGL